MKKILFLLMISCSAYCQNATIIYKDSTIRTRIKDYDYDGLVTKYKFMKWADVKKITFESKQSVSMTMVKNLNQYTTIAFINEGVELPKQTENAAVAIVPVVKEKQVISEQQFVDKVMTFDEYYQGNILPFRESSRSAKGWMVAGIIISAVGTIMISKASDTSTSDVGKGFVAVGGIMFVGGIIADIGSLNKLKKPKVLR